MEQSIGAEKFDEQFSWKFGYIDKIAKQYKLILCKMDDGIL